MFDCFHRLGHHAVVGSDYQHDNIGGFGAASAHHGERFMARSIEKNHPPLLVSVVGIWDLNAVGADMLGNPTGFTSNDISSANRIKQRSLTVIDVPHHSDNRRTWHFDVISVGGDQFLELFFGDHLFKWHERNFIAEALTKV